jgi:hypothetical protein
VLDAPLADDALDLIGEPSDGAIEAVVRVLIEAAEREAAEQSLQEGTA